MRLKATAIGCLFLVGWARGTGGPCGTGSKGSTGIGVDPVDSELAVDSEQHGG